MKRVITVKGKGKVSAPPDWIKIMMTLKASDMDYDKTMDIAANQLKELRNCLGKLGFKKEDIKTTSFHIDTSYERVKDYHGNYKSVFKGYRCSNELYIGFETDSKKLGEILSALSNCKAKPEFSIKYQIRDQKSLKEEMLKKAILDAKEKAKVIAEAAGVEIGNILRIDYDWSEIRFQREESYYLSEASYQPSIASIDIEPDDIKISDTVTVVREIKG